MDRLETALAAGDLLRIRAGEPLGKDLTVRPDKLDRVAGIEATLDRDHADREQARPALDQRRARARIDDEAAAGRLTEAQPQLERRHLVVAGAEVRAARLPLEDRQQHVLADAARDHRGDAGRGGHLCRDDLAAHATGAQARCGADLGLERARAVAQQLGAGRSRRARVDAVDLGEQDQQPCLHEHGDLRGQRVVVAERDLIGGGGVVLVDDGHCASLEDRLEGVAEVQVGGAVGDVGGGEQDLPGSHPVRRKRLIPGLLQPGLAERRRRLELRYLGRTLRQP